ncbi:hypothetical protein D9756_007227 [Leucocoprinus leucothites]|uniref:Uncharacterized protein n=1 Tax=Leucocoprinus leucothites TaxID=201217 RepID=A0A8H5FZF4_9AGAR|nr:hypothetical protein D9756_007227 [Leucoagaricus leucothites]
MTSVLHDLKEKLSSSKSAPNHPAGESVAPAGPKQGSDEQSFGILPHPAKSNDPADLQNPSENTGGLRSSQGPFEAFKAAPGPVLPNQESLNNAGPAKTREELASLQAQLNQK